MKRTILRVLQFLKVRWPFGPAPADPDELNQPAHEPVVNGKLVTIEVIRVNGQEPPSRSLEKAIKGFSKYVAGKVRTVQGVPVEVEADGNGLLTKRQLDSIIAERRYQGPSDITVLFLRGLSDYEYHSFSMALPNGSHVLVMQTRPRIPPAHTVWGLMRQLTLAVGKILLTSLVLRERQWHLVIKHELCHSLHLPHDRSRACSPRKGRHCTHPECLLYGRVDARWVLTAIVRLGLPSDLCHLCQSEVRRAQEAAGRLIGPEEPYDDLHRLNALVQLNPGHGLAYAYRAMGHWKQENREQAIEDLTKAIELGPRTKAVACHRNRGVMFAHMGQLGRAISDWERCLKLDPDNASVLNHLAWVLATCGDDGARDGSRAVELARHACELSNWENPGMLDTLAAACAEISEFDRAIEYQKKAISLAHQKESEEYRERLKLYRAGKPCRDTRP